jgi:hypothetical protein
MQESVHHDTEINAITERTTRVQHNVLPHDQLRNGRSVDDALWNGFEKPNGIQKAGLFIFAGFFMFVGLLGFVVAREVQNAARILNVIGVVMMLVGIKIGSNAFRIRKKKKLE